MVVAVLVVVLLLVVVPGVVLIVSNIHSGQVLREKSLHSGYSCDGCEGKIKGVRFKCLSCPDYDLCQRCKGNSTHEHHKMLIFETPETKDLWLRGKLYYEYYLFEGSSSNLRKLDYLEYNTKHASSTNVTHINIIRKLVPSLLLSW